MIASCSSRPHWVYVLRDPLQENVVRYVGCTSDPAKRLKWHLRLGSELFGYAPAYCWINSVLTGGAKPEMQIVSDSLSASEAYQFEFDLIKMFGRVGHKLAQTNSVPWHLRHLVECDGKLFHNTVVAFHDGDESYCYPSNDFLHSRIAGSRFRFADKKTAKSLDGRFTLQLS